MWRGDSVLKELSYGSQGTGLANAAFSNAYDPPSLAPQNPSHALVSSLVSFDFVSPELNVGLGQVLAFRATVPKTSIDEHRNLASRPREIRFARHVPVFSISPKTRRPEQFTEE